jgi:hypothetical protein
LNESNAWAIEATQILAGVLRLLEKADDLALVT